METAFVSFPSAGLNGTGPYVIEASRGGACDLAADESKLAGYLLAMEKYTYLSCFSSTPPTWFAAFDKPLGVPAGLVATLEESRDLATPDAVSRWVADAPVAVLVQLAAELEDAA